MRQRVEHFHFDEGVTLLLSKKYPISTRWVMKRCLGSFVAALIVGLFALLGLPYLEGLLQRPLAASQPMFVLIFSLLAVIFVIKLAYELLSRRYYYYAVEGSNLVIAKGIILRQRGCFPIAQVTDIYLNRTFSEFIFGLFSLNVSTPTAHSAEFARIDGLPHDTAIALQNELLHILYQEEHRDNTDSGERSLESALPPPFPRDIKFLEH